MFFFCFLSTVPKQNGYETISVNFSLTVRDVDTVEDMADPPPNASPEQEENAIQITLKNFQSESVSLKNYIC